MGTCSCEIGGKEMKRFLLAPLIFVVPLTALAGNFPGLKDKPTDFNEWFHLGVTRSIGNLLCVQWVNNDLTSDRTNYYIDTFVEDYKKEGKRFGEIVVAGFNDGLKSMEQVDERFKKCEQLKIK